MIPYSFSFLVSKNSTVRPMDQKSCIGYERKGHSIAFRVPGIKNRDDQCTSYFHFIPHKFSTSAHLISIYSIDILPSLVLFPAFSNCTPAMKWLFHHLCTNTPLPCLVCWFLQGGRRYSQNIAELFEWRGLTWYVFTVLNTLVTLTMKLKPDSKLRYLLSIY